MSYEHLTEAVLRRGEGDTLRASVFGDRITIKADGDRTQGTVTFLEYLSQPGKPGTPPHTHEAHEECFYVVEGRLSMLVDDRVVVAAPGDFVVAPRHVAHAFWNAGPELCRFVATFTPAGFDKVFHEFERLLDAGLPDEQLKVALRDLPARFGTTVVPWPAGTKPEWR